MTWFVWSLPTLALAAAVLSARVSVQTSAAIALAVAIAVSAWSAVTPFGIPQLLLAVGRGAWIGATIAPYILGGLVFWQVAGREADGAPEAPDDARPKGLAARRHLFFACFLVGPFAESATGFGVGMVGTVLMLRGMGFAPRHLMVFALLSQTMIPWGAMASGMLLAAAYVGITPGELGVHVALPVAVLMAVWLALFWRTARAAGIEGSPREQAGEAAWVLCGVALTAASTAVIGPEVALLSAYGPLIVLRFVLDRRPTTARFRSAARQALPYVVVVGGIALARLVTPIRQALAGAWQLEPFDDLPAFAPLVHAGIWFAAGAVATAAARGGIARLGAESAAAWKSGRQAVLTLFLFAMMAEVLAAAGISRAMASGLFAAMGTGAIVVTPVLSGFLGILTNSGNAPNSLFMPSLVALATTAKLSVPAVAAIQHTAGMALTLFSPVRMTITASLCGGAGEEGGVYRYLLPYAGAAFVVVIAGAWLATAL